MPFVFSYLLKLSLSLGLVFLFYQFVLRRLTFYTWNRWYLLGYTLLCFFLPFIDISLALEGSEMKDSPVVNWVPVLGEKIVLSKDDQRVGLNGWDYALLILLAGVMIMLIRLCMQLISIRRMRNRSSLISTNGIRVYQVDAPIIPFSFGDSIFINQQQHSTAELEEIIRHEFVHVKEKHSVDIIWGELLCLFNWYNPFAWLLKKSIRQNLEFIADRQVLEQGMDRKQYQYLLLKVIGNNHFSIANQFNFSSLKKRIAMMNKLRTSKVHLVKFMFVLPLVSVMLLAFRNEWKKQETGNTQLSVLTVDSNDTIPDKLPPPPPPPPPKGKGTLKEFLDRNPGVKNLGWVYHHDNSVAMIHVMKIDGSNEIYHTDNAEEMNTGAKKYGKFPVPPGAIAPPPPPGQDKDVWVQGYPTAPVAPVEAVTVVGQPLPAKAPTEVITVQGYKTPAKAPAAPAEVVTVQGYKTPTVKEVVVTGYAKPSHTIAPLPENVESILVKQGNKVEVQLKNGKKEYYDLNNINEKKKFNAKYPAPPPPPPAPAQQPIEVRGYKTNTSVAVEGKPLPENLIYVINGKISTKFEMEQLKPEQIASVDILKGSSAVALYGDNAKEGVVQIKLKNESNPLYVIDGEIASKEKMDQLKPEQIEAIDVLKGEKATAAYGDKGKNGVIQIRTKK
jgi:TonB-dependent SusC/RagA subfamily outer membrane receptor